MKFDLMVGALSWAESGQLAQGLETAGFGGMLFTEDGRRLLTLAGDVAMWDIEAGKTIWRVATPARIDQCLPHPDGQRLILGSPNGSIRLLRLSDGKIAGPTLWRDWSWGPTAP